VGGEVIQQSGTIDVHTDPPGRYVLVDFTLTVLPVLIGHRAHTSLFDTSPPHCRDRIDTVTTPSEASDLVRASRQRRALTPGTTAEDSCTLGPADPCHHHSRQTAPPRAMLRFAKPFLPQSLPASAPILPPSAVIVSSR
jgi:hypothetical protein